MWYQKNNPFTVFMDKRHTTEKFCTQVIKINPDVRAQWQNLPFKSESFDMVVFDPPHIIRQNEVIKGGMYKKYGILQANWKDVISSGSIELFRVLKQSGIFILKWCEVDKDVSEVLALIPYSPMFGTRTGQKNNTHWICFLKYNPNACLSDFGDI